MSASLFEFAMLSVSVAMLLAKASRVESVSLRLVLSWAMYAVSRWMVVCCVLSVIAGCQHVRSKHNRRS